jgi:hypothetical protein
MLLAENQSHCMGALFVPTCIMLIPEFPSRPNGPIAWPECRVLSVHGEGTLRAVNVMLSNEPCIGCNISRSTLNLESEGVW